MYIDFKILKQKLEVKSVLNFFGIDNLKLKNGSYSGICPIHRGDNSTAFHFDTNKKIFHCWTKCGGGNILDFIAKFKKVDIYQAAVIGIDIIGDNSFLNNSLNFKLSLDYGHAYLKKRNISIDTAKFFDAGFCNYGFLKERIAIPIYDNANNLVAYAGRSIDDSEPKYLFPKNFQKSNYLYNFNKIANSLKHNGKIFIVEGFFDVFRLYQFGLSALALMGTALSENQLKQLKMLNAYYILMLDGDEAGKSATKIISNSFQDANLNFSVVNLNDKKDPDSLDTAFLKSLAIL